MEDTVKRGYAASFKTVESLGQNERASMARLYLSYYDNADETMFFRDLDAKDEVEMIYFDGDMVGFSALMLYETEWQGNPIRVAYSGDTIVRREHWGQQALIAAWLGRMGQAWKELPGVPFYWFLLVKGHRTYRFLPSLALEYHPDHRVERSGLRALADKLAGDKFGADYNPRSGVVEFAESRGNLGDGVAYPTERELRNPWVRFFFEKNPGYLRGHELVCLCRISPDNMKPRARRIFEGGHP
ncbi:MAG: hypothetical protein LBF92_01615 [Synergistaceae bacterium]|nr:hypothetical protein [Synergistaceae bacterium]